MYQLLIFSFSILTVCSCISTDSQTSTIPEDKRPFIGTWKIYNRLPTQSGSGDWTFNTDILTRKTTQKSYVDSATVITYYLNKSLWNVSGKTLTFPNEKYYTCDSTYINCDFKEDLNRDSIFFEFTHTDSLTILFDTGTIKHPVNLIRK